MTSNTFLQQVAILLLLAISMLFTGCGSLRSSFEYTKGTQCLNKRNFPQAVIHLEKAVELDPTFSRNQNNLACAYLATGQIEKAWYHFRQAVLCFQHNPEAITSFKNVCAYYVTERGFDRLGISENDVLQNLGMPDSIITCDGRLFSTFYYGIYVMKFKNQILVSTQFIS